MTHHLTQKTRYQFTTENDTHDGHTIENQYLPI